MNVNSNSNADQIFSTELEIAQLRARKDEIFGKRRAFEEELSRLSARVRSSNSHKTRLSPEEYRVICNRQAVLRKKILEMENEARPVQSKIRELQALATAERVEANQRVAVLGYEALTTSGAKLREDVISLRDTWLAFAEDQTRVNSMRIMAAQFARELTEILAKVSSEQMP